MNKFLGAMLCAALLGTAVPQTARAGTHRVRQQTTYMMGVAISFADSAVYITDLQPVDSASIQRKTHFLMDRQAYSMQLQHYLEAQRGASHLTTAVCFGGKRKKMERRYLSVHRRYAKRGDLRIVPVDLSQFRFHAVEYIGQQTEQTVQKAAKTKKEKKK